MLCIEFPPVNTTGNFRSAGFARHFTQHDADVCVLTADENSQTAIFNKSVDRSLMNGLEKVYIHRFPIKPLARFWQTKWGNFLRIWWNLTDGIDKRWYNKKNKPSIHQVISEFQPDCVYVSLPPFSMSSVALIISKKWDIPLITDMRDAWSLWGVGPFQTPIHYKLVKLLERKLFYHSSLILSVTDELGADFLSQHPQLATRKLRTIFNGFDADLVKNPEVFQQHKTSIETIKIGYVGSFYYLPKAEQLHNIKWYKRKGLKKMYYWPRKENWIYRSPYFFLKALSRLIEQQPVYQKKVVFEHVGHCPEWLSDMISDLNLKTNFYSHGFQPKTEVLRIQNTWHGILATSEEVEGGNHYCLPSKSFDMVASKKLILGFITPGSQKSFYEGLEQFIPFDPSHVDKNAKKLSSLIENVFKKPHESSALSDLFSREVQSAILLSLIKEIKN